MNDEKELRDNQREIFKRVGDAEQFIAAQKEVNKNTDSNYKLLDRKIEERVSHLEESLSEKMLSMTEILTQKLNQIHETTTKTNGNVIRNRADIDGLKEREAKIIGISKDLDYLTKATEQQDDEIEKLKSIVEPINTLTRFPQTIKYIVIGFLIVVIISMWGIVAISREAKSAIEKEVKVIPEIEESINKQSTN